MFWKILPARIWALGLFLIVVLGAAFYLVLAQTTNSTNTQQLLRREQTVARAESSNITSFFQVFGESMAVLSQLKSVQFPNGQILEDMDAFVGQWKDTNLIGGVLLTDVNGLVKFNSNVLGTRDTGISLADRDYFLWAKNNAKEGEHFMGKPVVSRLGGSKGQYIIPVAAPVFQNGVFIGVLAASVELKPLTEHFLGLLKVSDQTDTFLIDQNGKILYDPKFDDIGKNVSETLGNNIKGILGTTQEGTLQTSYLDPISGKNEDHLIAYSPVLLSSQKWVLVMGAPIQNLWNITTPIHIKQIAVLTLVILTVLLFGLIVAREKIRITTPPDQTD